MKQRGLWRAGDLVPLVEIEDDGPVVDALNRVTVGWRMERASPPDPLPDDFPLIHVRREPGGWRCWGTEFPSPVTYEDLASVACAVLATLYKAHTLVNLENLVLHAAGVRVGEGLVLITGHYRAGKTIVTAAAAAAGLQVFSDDIIPLAEDARTALAPGLAMRPRLPLPEVLASDTRAFIERWRILEGPNYLYVRPPGERLAPRGVRAPVAGIVTLRRSEDPDTPARLTRLGPGDALAEAIRRNFARRIPAGRILDSLDALIASVPSFALSYGRAEEAVALIADVFGGARSIPEIAEDAPSFLPADGRAARPLSARALVRRVEGIVERERGGQAFLADPDEEVIFALNPTGSALWRLIDEPLSFEEIVAVFAAAFPDQDPAEIATDLSGLIRALAIDGLVVIEGDAGAAEGF